jgi:hypothetical protein
MVYFESFYKFLLIIHLIATFALLGCLTHNLVIVTGYLRGRFIRQNLEWLYLRLSFYFYIITYAVGILLYPAYGVHIRQPFFDKCLPWATGLFEVKEHWAALALALLIACYFLRRTFQPEKEKDKLFLYVPLCFLLNLIVWYKTIVGSLLTILKGSW